MARAPLDFSMSVAEAAFQMAENNTEALHILKRVLVEQPNSALGIILDLDDMQMRGIQIVAAFKHCKESIADFVQACMDRNDAMVKQVNKAVPALRAYHNGSEARSMRDSSKKHQHGMRCGGSISAGFSRGAREMKSDKPTTN